MAFFAHPGFFLPSSALCYFDMVLNSKHPFVFENRACGTLSYAFLMSATYSNLPRPPKRPYQSSDFRSTEMSLLVVYRVIMLRLLLYFLLITALGRGRGVILLGVNICVARLSHCHKSFRVVRDVQREQWRRGEGESVRGVLVTINVSAFSSDASWWLFLAWGSGSGLGVLQAYGNGQGL